MTPSELAARPEAYLALVATAEARVWMARPEGVGRAITAYQMPIEGRDEWIAAVEQFA